MSARGASSLRVWYMITAACLALAYWATLPRAAEVSGSFTVARIDKQNVAAVIFKSPAQTIEAKKSETGPWWISKVGSKPKDGVSTADGAEVFVASQKFVDLLATLAPLVATRDLGVVDAGRYQEFGLAENTKTFEARDKSDKTLIALTIGKSLYGSRATYVMNNADRRVWLISGSWLSEIERPELHYFERSLIGADFSEVAGAEIEVSGRVVRYAHTRRDANGALLWTGKDSETADGAASVWFSRFEQVKAALYADRAASHEFESLPVLFVVRVDLPDGRSETLSFRKKPQGGQTEYWVFSSFLGAHVKIATSRGESLERDLASLLPKT